jgi:hypothetical protein
VETRVPAVGPGKPAREVCHGDLQAVAEGSRAPQYFSKKVENHACAVALHYMFYNFAKIHKTLRVTPELPITFGRWKRLRSWRTNWV